MPNIDDGPAVHSLIAHCPPLDANSLYCNLLQCTHFASTCALAERRNHVVGFVSGYLVPGTSDTLFIWQVAVDPSARGARLGARMIEHILEREQCSGISWLHTTVTEANAPSWAMFERLAHRHGASLRRSVMFERESHLADTADSEFLAVIGPFTRPLNRRHRRGEPS